MKSFVLVRGASSFQLLKKKEENDGPVLILPARPRILTLHNPTSGLPLVKGVVGHLWSLSEEVEAWREKAWREVEARRLGSWKFAPPPWEDAFFQMVKEAVEVAECSFDSSLAPTFRPSVAEPIPERIALTSHAIKLSSAAQKNLEESVEKAEQAVLDAWGDKVKK